MSMLQSEWAARVAAIGKLAGWGPRKIAQFSEPRQITFLLFDRMGYDLYAPGPDRAIAAIRQLAADWLAAEGVAAQRWQTGTPYAVAGGRAYWCLCEHGYTLCRFKDGYWTANTDGRRRRVSVIRWQELDGINYEVTE